MRAKTIMLYKFDRNTLDGEIEVKSYLLEDPNYNLDIFKYEVLKIHIERTSIKN